MIVYVIVPPAGAPVEAVVFAIARSAEMMLVVAVAVLLPEMLSNKSLDATTLSTIVPEVAMTFTTSVKVALAPFASDAFVQVIVPPAPTAGVVHEKPAGAMSDANVTPAGSVCVIFAFVAAFGPLFVIVCVYVIVPAGETGSGVSTFVATSSAIGVVNVVGT